jgi:ferritin
MVQRLAEALNRQINKEFFSSYLYLSMSAHSEALELSGFANWFAVQAQEEQTHGMKIYNYLVQKGVKIELEAIEKPETEFKNIQVMFKKALQHEQMMTRSFNELSDLAMELKDHSTYNFLQWFVNEQVEEEATVGSILTKVRRTDGNNSAIYLLDRELEGRTFVDETAQ